MQDKNFCQIITNQMIAGDLILFNPSSDVFNNIESYIKEIDHLFVIDNSEKVNENLVQSFFLFQKIELVYNQVNLGIAKALNIAVEKSIKADYKFLLTMDQDSYFEENSANNLLAQISDNNAAIYSPFHKNKYFTNPPLDNGVEEVSDVMTSGNILNLEAVKKVGLFKEDYFIDYVDVEYCLRLRKNGYKILRVNDSFLVHNEANLSKKSFLGKTVYPPNHKPFRWYYKVRNYLYLKEEYQNDFPEYFIKESQNIRNNIIKVILFEKSKIQKLKLMAKGYFHYRKRITGKLTE